MSAALLGFADDNVIIMSAPNGARRSQADHPSLPVTPAELAANAAALLDAGVSVLHLHVRDEHGQHTLDADRYRNAIAAVEDRVGDSLIIQVTTEAVGQYTAEQQMAVVRELNPEAVSLALREVCPVDSDEAVMARFCVWMLEQKIWPQYILYSVEDVEQFDGMRERGVFADEAPFAMLVLGNYADKTDGTVAELDTLLAAADFRAIPWAVCCFGRHENAVMLAALSRGGHVRIGFENNVLMGDGSAAPDNAALIHQFVEAAGEHRRRPAPAIDIRAACAQDTDKSL